MTIVVRVWIMLCLVTLSRTMSITVCPVGCSVSTLETAALYCVDGDEILLAGGTYSTLPSATISARVTLRAAAPVTVSGSGVWLTIASDNVTTYGTFALFDAGIAVGPNATWHQKGPVSIYHGVSAAGQDPLGQPFGIPCAVSIEGGTWVQDDRVNITARTDGVCLAGAANATGIWDQRAHAHIGVPSNGAQGDSHTGVLLGAGRTVWLQSASLSVDVGVGVGIRAGAAGLAQWNQTGNANMTVAARSGTGAVYAIALAVGFVDQGATWHQRGRLQLSLGAVGIGAVAGGISLDANDNSHRWEQRGSVDIVMDARNGSIVRGIRLGQRSTTWAQEGPLTMTGAARSGATVHAVVLESPVWSGNLWRQSGSLVVDIVACADGSSASVTPSAAIRASSRCATWESTGNVTLTAMHSCAAGDVGAYALWIDSQGCDFTLERAAEIEGNAAVVRCDASEPAPNPVSVRGLPAGTTMTGACDGLVLLLPVVDILWEPDTVGVVGWERPMFVSAHASVPFVGQVPLTVSHAASLSLQANSTHFVFGGGNVSRLVRVDLIDRVGDTNGRGEILLQPAGGMLLGRRTAAAFDVLPWVQPIDLDALLYAADIDTSTSTLVITPKDRNGTVIATDAMAVRFAALTERGPDGLALNVLRLDAGNGRWTQSATPVTQGAAQEFVMRLQGADDTDGSAVSIFVAFFDRQVDGLFDGIVPFRSDPSLAKTSIQIDRWSWTNATGARIELSLAFDPPFDEFTRVDDASSATFVLKGSTAGNGNATVRLSSAAIVDGWFTTDSVTARADPATAAVIVSLPPFVDRLVYDPDVGILFGRPTGDGSGRGKQTDGSSDETVLIIAASASIGGAVGLSIATILVAIAVVWYRQWRLARTVGGVVGFDAQPSADANL